MILLRNFTLNDFPSLVGTSYGDMSESAFLAMASAKSHNGAYFEIFAVCRDNVIVGSVSFFQLRDDVISLGPEIFPKFRRQGLAFAAVEQAMDMARAKGYHTFEAQIRQNNIASIRLHEKLGFRRIRAMVNKKGNPVYIYMTE